MSEKAKDVDVMEPDSTENSGAETGTKQQPEVKEKAISFKEFLQGKDNQANKVYTIFIGLFLANLLMGLTGFSLIRLFSKVINIPKKYLLPVIFSLTFVGAYAYNNSLVDVFVMVFFGFLGYFMNKMEFSPSSVVIGIILGSLAENNFRGSLMMSDGDMTIFLNHPICIIFILIAFLSLFSPLLGKYFKRLKKSTSN